MSRHHGDASDYAEYSQDQVPKPSGPSHPSHKPFTFEKPQPITKADELAAQKAFEQLRRWGMLR